MQFVSKGLGLGGSLYANVRAATSDIAQGARALHHARPPGLSPPLHTPVPPPTYGVKSAASHAGRGSTATTGNLAGRFVQTARTALSRFVAHLTTPGLSHPVASESGVSWGRGLSTRVNATVRPPTIAQGLSPGARMALASRMGSGASSVPAYVSKPPGWSVTQVGFGTSRNFCSTTRPLFQHLAEGVPIAVRALNEVDLDVEKRRMKDGARRYFREEMAKANTKKVEKENANFEKMVRPTTSKMPTPEPEEVEHYFTTPASAVPGLMTVLLIPLAPTPTNRVPLSDTHSTAEPRLLSLPDAQDLVYSHRKHSLRVASLFARLDFKQVWRNGASITSHGDARGLCTILRVEFKGWTAEMVRGVLGDAGLGWCRLVEIYGEEPDTEARSVLGSCQSPARSFTPEHDPTASVVLPTLDLSERNLPMHLDMDAIDSTELDAELESAIGELLTDYDVTSEASSRDSRDISDAP